MKKSSTILLSLLIGSINFSIVNAQVISGSAPGAGVPSENDPYANFFQKWTPMMQKLFQEVKNNQDYIEYNIGPDVGSAYVTDSFIPGKVYYDDEHLGDVYYRYNAYNNEIELKKTNLPEEKEIALIKDEKITLKAKDVQLKFSNFYTSKNSYESGYLNLIYTGNNYTVYERIYITYSEGKPAQNSMVNPIPSKFTNYVNYFIQTDSEDRIKEIPTKKNKFISMFDESNSFQIEEYIKNENLNLKNKIDIIKIINKIEFYNS
ncbi:hypothetical protein [Maribacter sp. 1_MG-2023]|uniref:hypothetical protein n=1 Tax=Maribacter sp. 1_MG-2023 TaxID=3062677 RepID=UPI0026E23338|nr:hypothetical protein [Maribacter sp. 1_MG-2023]MDO6470142.1 hypothetical protein [Maribacter sp. 1_MG-2023]